MTPLDLNSLNLPITVEYLPSRNELLSNLVFESFWSCGDLALFGGLDAVFECDAGDDFGAVVKAA